MNTEYQIQTSVLIDEEEGGDRNSDHHHKNNEFNPNTSEALTSDEHHDSQLNTEYRIF
jgi:hypothetical protein